MTSILVLFGIAACSATMGFLMAAMFSVSKRADEEAESDAQFRQLAAMLASVEAAKGAVEASPFADVGPRPFHGSGVTIIEHDQAEQSAAAYFPK